MNENQIKLIEQAKKYISKYLPELATFYSCYNHYAFKIYHNADISEEDSLCDIDTVNAYGSKRPIVTYDACHRICFGRFLKAFLSSSPARVQFIWLPYFDPHRIDSANFVWMTEEQLKEHISFPKNYYGLDYDVRLYTPKDSIKFCEVNESFSGNYYTIVFDFKKLTYIEIKFVLFWSRYAAEFPSNFAFLDALLLKQKYPEEELLNLLIMASMYFNRHNSNNLYISASQCISLYGKFATREYLLRSMKNYHQGNLVDIFERGPRSLHSEYSEFDERFFLKCEYVREGEKVDLFQLDRRGHEVLLLSKYLEESEVEYRLMQYEELYKYYKEEELK